MQIAGSLWKGAKSWMKNRAIVIAAVIFALCICACAGIAIYGRSLVVHTGIIEFSDIDAIEAADITLRYVMNRQDESMISPLLDMDDNEIDDILGQSDAILIVEPVGGISQYTSSFSQDMSVKKVLHGGSDTSEGDVIRIFRSWGMRWENDVISYTDSYNMNIFYPGNEYMVFLTAWPIQEYSDFSGYYLAEFPVSAVNLDRSVAGATCPSYDFGQCRDVLYLSSSEKLSEMYVQMEERLLAMYNS